MFFGKGKNMSSADWNKLGTISTVVGVLATILGFVCEKIDDKVAEHDLDEKIATEVSKQLSDGTNIKKL